MEFKKIILSIVFVLLLMNDQLSGTSAVSIEHDFSPSSISGFISFLLNNREYYRAYAELERLVSYYPDYISNISYAATANYLMFKGGAYTRITQDTGINFKGDALSEDISAVFKIDSFIKLREYDKAEKLYRVANTKRGDEFPDTYFMKRGVYFSLYNNTGLEGMDKGFSIDDYNELYRYSQNIHNMKKDPWKGMAAGIIPGMGYVYAGETGTGIVAMIVTGLGVSVTALGYKNGMEAFAVLSGAATGFFYGGSIIGGYRETVRYNRNLMDRLDLRLQRDLEFDRHIDDIFVKFGIKN